MAVDYCEPTQAEVELQKLREENALLTKQLASKTRQEQWTFDVATGRKTLLGQPIQGSALPLSDVIADLQRMRRRRFRTPRGMRFSLMERDRIALESAIQVLTVVGHVHSIAVAKHEITPMSEAP